MCFRINSGPWVQSNVTPEAVTRGADLVVVVGGYVTCQSTS